MADEQRPPVPRLGLWWAVAAVLGGGLAYAATDHILRAGVVFSAAILLAAVLRAVAPERLAGGLVVRGRVLDVLTYLLLGGILLAMTLTLDLRARL